MVPPPALVLASQTALKSQQGESSDSFFLSRYNRRLIKRQRDHLAAPLNTATKHVFFSSQSLSLHFAALPARAFNFSSMLGLSMVSSYLG